MSPLAFYRHKYRLHQSYSRYPRITMVSDILKSAGLFGIVAASTWFTFSVMMQQSHSGSHIEVSTQFAQNKTEVDELIGKVATHPISAAEIEIPATLSTRGNTGLNLVSNVSVIYESKWILQLPDDKFVIQLGSSANKALIEIEAKALPTGPVAIFPFKETPSARPVYGYSSGVYDSLDDALQAIDTMPKSLVANGPWVRPVSQLKTQIRRLSIGS